MAKPTARQREVQPDRTGKLEVDGYQIHWEYFGRGEREVVCLLNGLAMHTRAWYGFLRELRPDFDLLLYDYLGQGQSSCPDVPYSIPDFCRYLTAILDHVEIDKFHVMGISYGGFIALDYGRLFQDRLHTMTVSGILLSHERLFQMYQDLSLRFYRSGLDAFDLYTHYMYEKIFGERFVSTIDPAELEKMRRSFYDRYKDRLYCLIRLTEAQDPFFDRLDDNLPDYRAIRVPTLIVTGAQDRAIPPWVQRKLCDILAANRFELLDESGHVVYLERRDAFFPLLKAFMRTKSLNFELPGG